MQTPRPLYRTILRDAFRMTFKNVALWPLGLVAGFLLSGSAYDAVLRGWESASWILLGGRAGLSLQETTLALFGSGTHLAAVRLHQLVPGDVPFVALLVLCLVVVTVLALFCQGALLAAIAHTDEGDRPNFATMFKEGRRHMGRLLGLNLLLRAALAIVFFAVTILFIPAIEGHMGLAAFSAVLAFVLLAPFAYAATVTTLFALLGVVHYNESVRTSLKNAWRLTKKHWLVILEASLVIVLVDILTALAIVIALLVLTAPFAFLFLISRTFLNTTVAWLFTTLYLSLVAAVMLALASWSVTFHYAAWALLADRVRRNTAVAKVVRIFHRLRGTASAR